MTNSDAALAAYYQYPSMNPTTTSQKTAVLLANPPKEIIAYCTYFLKRAPYRKKVGGQMGLSENALRNYVIFCQHFGDFEAEFHQGALTFSDLDRQVVEGFIQWLLDKKQFSQNYAGRLLGTLKTLCLDAKKSEIETHPYVRHISGFTQRQTARIINILTFEDLHAIEQVPLDKEHLNTTRNWIILGFWLGQRVSDLLSLRPHQLRAAPNGGLYVDILQKKTTKKITVGVIDPRAIQILRHQFPKKLSPQRFNLYLKRVLEAAGLNQQVSSFKFNPKTQRKEMGVFPKYKVISSHDLRRSFATNFFGKIPTPVLMQMTGHSKESTFMSYIGRDPNRDSYADSFMEGVVHLVK
ncbi:MAG: phage integrase SAM-like domain-containing protein [Flavobacteriaceae bacterium]|nr:phage integrase SAM-like domain-containing protein [Flavobacteriaceae bacterium]